MSPCLQPFLLAFYHFIPLLKMDQNMLQIVASCKSLQNQTPACVLSSDHTVALLTIHSVPTACSSKLG